MLHEFYNKFVKFKRILTYTLKILKTYFWQENILLIFNIRIKNLHNDNIIRDNNLLLQTFNIRIEKFI